MMHSFFYLVVLLACANVGDVLAGNTLEAFRQRAAVFDGELREQRHARSEKEQTELSREMLKERAASPYLNANTKKFVVNGSGIPDVHFDIGESYAGLLPTSSHKNETRKLFFWFFPSTNPAASNEITLWFAGGPGCSGLGAVIDENGPFLWKPGTYRPTKNPYSWNTLTNMLYFEQPIGVGYTQGKPDIVDEIGLAQQFIGFYKNFESLFGVKGRNIYITGESYGGMYEPYVSDAMLTDGFNIRGLLMYDPVIGDPVLQFETANTAFLDHWAPLFNLNASTTAAVHGAAASCGYADYFANFFKFPPPTTPFPATISYIVECDVQSAILLAAQQANPCFNIYHITDTCPFPWNVLGTSLGGYNPPSAPAIYFARADVAAALNAPYTPGWQQCTTQNVFPGPHGNNSAGDLSPPPALSGVLSRVVDKINNTLIGNGGLDFLLVSNGTLLVLQNLTWNGVQGFQAPPTKKFIVPSATASGPNQGGVLAGSGELGVWARERGLTFFTVENAGHMVPQWQAGAVLRSLEVLLGRVEGLGSARRFTTGL